MNNKKVRFILVFVLVCLVLSLSSCKKNNGGNSFVSSLLSSNNSDVDPLVTVADPNAKKETESAKVESISSVESSSSSSSSSISTSTSEVAVTEVSTQESEEVETVVVPEVTTVALENQELYVVEDEFENALLSDDVPLIETVFSYKGIEASLDVFSTFTRIILPEGTTDDDIALCASLLCSAYPTETSYVTYKKVEGCLVLTYPRCDKDFLSSILDVLVEEGKLYIDRLIPTLEESEDEDISYSVSFTVYGDVDAILRLTPTTLVVTTNRALTTEEFNEASSASLSAIPELETMEYELSEKGISFAFDKKDDESLSDMYSRVISLLNTYCSNVVEMNKVTLSSETTNVVAPDDTVVIAEENEAVSPVAPVTEKGRKVLSFEAGLSGSVYYDIKHNQLRATVDGRFSYQITEKFSIGVKGGYDWGNYVSLMGYMEYNVSKKIYLFAGAGYRFDLDSNTNYSSFVLEAGVGFEHNIASSFYVFGEVGVKYAPQSYSKITPSLSLGFNYKFSF